MGAVEDSIALGILNHRNNSAITDAALTFKLRTVFRSSLAYIVHGILYYTVALALCHISYLLLTFSIRNYVKDSQ